MPAAYLGGWNITAVEWTGRNAVRITFETVEFTSKLFQAYVNRSLAGATLETSQRTITVPIPYTPTAAPLTLVAVEPEDRLTDFSASLAWAPWNIYCLTWSVPSPLPSDLDHFDVLTSSAVGEAYDSSNVVARVPYVSGRTDYSIQLPAIEATGDWEAAVIPRDDAEPDGNAGTAATETISAVIYPADLPLDSAGRRFTTSISSGVLTASYTCP